MPLDCEQFDFIRLVAVCNKLQAPRMVQQIATTGETETKVFPHHFGLGDRRPATRAPDPSIEAPPENLQSTSL